MGKRWDRFREIYFGREKPKPEPKPETIDGWKMDIGMKDKVIGHTLYNDEMKPLWKVYNWYLTKDSDRYNVLHKDGMYVINRKDITYMALTKTKLLKSEWT
jgi:hypothetical protein